MTKIYFYSLGIINTFILSLLAKPALADFGLGEAGNATNLPKGSLAQFLGNFAGAALALSGSIFLFLIVYGGIIMMTAAGDTNKVTKGKDILKWAIIGALVLGSAYAITNLIFTALKGSA